jgi:hypothetical protein
VGSWASPKRQPHVPPIAAPAHEENPTEEDPPTTEEDQETAEEDPLFLPFEEDPAEEDRTFKPADLPHYQNGHGNSGRKCLNSQFRPAHRGTEGGTEERTRR